MKIQRQVLDSYQRNLRELSKATQSVLLARLATITYRDYDELYYEIYQAFMEVVGQSATVSAGYAAQLYDAIRMAEIGEALGATAITTMSDEGVQDTMHAVVTLAATDRLDDAIYTIIDRAGYEVGHSAIGSMLGNGDRDRVKVRYARVPGWSKTYGDGCPFCKMLASRGFVYRNALTAGEAYHYHANCTCTVIPSFDGKTGVQGYDPSKYRSWYEENKVLEATDPYKWVEPKNARPYVRYVGEERVASVGGMSMESLRGGGRKLLTEEQYAEYAERYGLQGAR